MHFNFKNYDVITSNNYNLLITQYLKSKYNLIMEYGQLTERNMRNIFLEILHTICGGKTSPRTFSKKPILSISLDQQSEILYSLLSLYVKISEYQNTLRSADHLLLPHKAFS